MPKLLKTLLFVSILALVTAPSGADDTWPPGVERSIRALEQALQDNDFTALKGLLAPDFRYTGQGGVLARTIMEQVVAGYPAGLARVTILDVRENADTTLTVRTAFETAAGPEEHAIRLSGDGRLLQAEVARIRLAGRGPRPPGKARPRGRGP